MENQATTTNSESEWYKLQNAVKSWILSNAHYQGDRMDRTTAENTANAFLNKVHVYDIHDDFEHNTEKIFKVYIGHPKFRGTVNYTLPEHSLRFNSAQPTNVRILNTGNDTPEWWSTIQSSFINTGLNPLLGWGTTSMHPHINPDGQPCLGGWSNAWSYAISSGDIPSLINVAKSFLNTWTRADSYWDINRHYRDWDEMFNRSLRGLGEFFPFQKCLQHAFLWQRLARNIESSYRWSPKLTWSWLASNYEIIQQLCHENGDDYKWKIYDYYLATVISSKNTADTESRKLKKLNSTIHMLDRMITGITDILTEEIGCAYWVSKRLVGDAMLYGLDKLDYGTVKHIHLVQDSDGNYPPGWNLSTLIQRMSETLNSRARELRPQQARVEMIDIGEVFETMRNANRGKSIINRGFLSEEDYYVVLLDYIGYGPRWHTGTRSSTQNTFHILENMLTFAYNEKVWDANELIRVGVELSEDDYLSDRNMLDDTAPFDNMFTLFHNVIDDEESRNRIIYHFVCLGIERYTKICMKQLNGRMKNAKEHYRWEEEVVQPGNPRTNVA